MDGEDGEARPMSTVPSRVFLGAHVTEGTEAGTRHLHLLDRIHHLVVAMVVLVVVTAVLVVAGTKKNETLANSYNFLHPPSIPKPEMFRVFQNLYSYMTGEHTLRSRFANAATNPFQLISITPFYDETKGALDFNRPYKFQTEVTVAAPNHKLNHAFFGVAKIACADDICVHAVTPPHIVAKSWGFDRVLREALLEVARRPETAQCRFIAFTHPMLGHGLGHGPRIAPTGKKTPNAIVLKNTAATAGSKDWVMLVKLESAPEFR